MTPIKYANIKEVCMKTGLGRLTILKYCKEGIIDCKQILPEKWVVGLTENGSLIYIKDLKAQKP